jgi:YebC/PmpR family DNA-binding regulatory protein
MAGHSHWANIKHKKAANDAKRGKVWSKVSRALIVAAKNGGGDPDQNLTLRYAIEKAKEANLPKDTIANAIKKGTGDLDGQEFVDVLYEGYGSGGIAIMAQSLTDNRNRTAPEIRRIFEKRAGTLGATGCVSYMFAKKGIFVIEAEGKDEDEVMEIALDAGADDFNAEGITFEITCEADSFDSIKQVLSDKGIETAVAELSMIAEDNIEITDEDQARKILGLIDDLEDHDDVQDVYANFDISEALAEKIEG